MLAFLLEVVALEVVDDGEVVDVAATWGDIPMLITFVVLIESSNKFRYAKNKDGGQKFMLDYLQTYFVGALDSRDD